MSNLFDRLKFGPWAMTAPTAVLWLIFSIFLHGILILQANVYYSIKSVSGTLKARDAGFGIFADILYADIF